MPPNTPDRQVQKTRKLLQEALLELVAERGYESVTVQAILDKANVGRSTFYAHFQHKDHLLHSLLEDLNELFEQLNQRLFGATENVTAVEHTALTLSLFQFIGQHYRFFKGMLMNRGYGIFSKPIYDHVFAQVYKIFAEPIHAERPVDLSKPFKRLESRANHESLESRIAAHYFASALMGIVVWWVEDDMPCPAE